MSEHYMGEQALFRKVFDDDFAPISFFADEKGRLGSIELMVKHGGHAYVLSVESYPTHVEREAIDGDGQSHVDPSIVLASEEILPSDIMSIKAKPFEELQPYLVLQESSS